jgi:hypothetical protein
MSTAAATDTRDAHCNDPSSPLRKTGYILKGYAPDVPPRVA